MEDSCAVNDNGEFYLEQSDVYVREVFTLKGVDYQPILFLSVMGSIISILLLNSMAMTVTKYLSALTRNVVQVTTITLVWVVSLMIGWEVFVLGQLFGFVILAVGSLIYGEIIRLPKRFGGKSRSEVLSSSETKEQISLQQNEKLVQDE